MVEDDISSRFNKDLLAWSEENERSFLWRDESTSLYKVFMSEMFLRRTRADVVKNFIPEFFEAYPDIESLQGANQEDLADVIRPMGLQNKRAKGLIELAQHLDDEVPSERNELLKLPQVGPYVANATLCFALDRQLPIVDRNVKRIYRRLFGETWRGLTESEQWELADNMLPQNRVRRYNLALLDFAAAVCTAQNPNCEECFAKEYCAFYHEMESIEELQKD